MNCGDIVRIECERHYGCILLFASSVKQTLWDFWKLFGTGSRNFNSSFLLFIFFNVFGMKCCFFFFSSSLGEFSSGYDLEGKCLLSFPK